MPKKCYRRIMPLVCLLLICFIFLMSSDPNSDKKTIKLSEEIHNTVSEEIDSSMGNRKDISVKQIDLLIRKSSHFFEYLALCILLLSAYEGKKISLRTSTGYILLICLLVANLDEFYQSFIPGRNSNTLDCLIDFGGSLTGLTIYLCIRYFLKKSRQRSR